MPMGSFRNFQKFSWINQIKILNKNFFEDVSLDSKLTITELFEGANKYNNYLDINISVNPVLNKYLEVNNSKPKVSIDFIEGALFSTKHFTSNDIKDYCSRKGWNRAKIFVQSCRNNSDNVHRKGFDVDFNYYGKEFTSSDQIVIGFKSSRERQLL